MRIVVLLLMIASCAPPPGVRDPSVAIERFYFGRNAGDTLLVTDSSWSSFLAEVVTPRFPDGLTFWRAEGQWRGVRGITEREPSFVLEIIHPIDRSVEQAFTEIIVEYKRRFHQEAVLRVRTEGRVSY